jgi:hypothetical protein
MPTRRATRVAPVTLLLLLGLLLAAPARPQDPVIADEIRNDTDPTKPIILSLRDEYYNLRGDLWQNAFIVRADRFVLGHVGLPGNSRGFLLRADLPLVTSGDGQATRSGLGDLYAQALVIPRLGKTFTLAWGTGMVLPTATNSVGSGKFQLAPAVAPVWFFGRLKGFAFVKLQDFVSVAGDADRPDIHYFLVTPTVLWRLTRSWWIVADSESKTDWKRGNATSFRSGFQIGKMLSPRLGVWIKSEIPWGPNRLGSWTLKLTAFWTRY